MINILRQNLLFLQNHLRIACIGSIDSIDPIDGIDSIDWLLRCQEEPKAAFFSTKKAPRQHRVHKDETLTGQLRCLFLNHLRNLRAP